MTMLYVLHVYDRIDILHDCYYSIMRAGYWTCGRRSQYLDLGALWRYSYSFFCALLYKCDSEIEERVFD